MWILSIRADGLGRMYRFADISIVNFYLMVELGVAKSP